MESEKKQRVRKREQIGDKIEEELLPMEHTERRGNKTVTVLKETPCAYVSDLKEQIISYVDGTCYSFHAQMALPSRLLR